MMKIDADVPPPQMESAEQRRYRVAAFHARRLYPGVVGEILALAEVAEFGYRLGMGATADRLARHLEDLQQERDCG